MAWQDIARVVAPTIATGLLGPLGGIVANIAGGFLFPADTDKTKLTPMDVANKIAALADPADMAKLQQAEQAVRQYEADNNFRFAQLEAASVDSARTMRTGALASGNRTADRLAWLTLISFLTITVVVLTIVGLLLSGVLALGEANKEVWVAVSGLIGSILGYFSSNATQVIGFYFGSSSGSAAKSDQMAQHATDTLSVLGRSLDEQPRAAPPKAAAPTPPPPPAPAPVTLLPETAVIEVTPTARDTSADPMTRWRKSMDFVLKSEGGFSDIAADRGGPTNMGITQATLAHARGRPVSAEEVRALTQTEAEDIYQKQYWDAVRGDDLPAGVDLCAFDTAVLCGPGRAGTFLQLTCGLAGVDVDGRIGKQTLTAVGRMKPTDVIAGFAQRRIQFHKDIVAKDPSQQPFLQGWLNRVDALQLAALQMANS